MKHFYFFLFSFFAFNLSFGQVIITEIADPNNNANARFIELTNIGQDAFDLTGYNLIRWTNGNSGPSTGSERDLSSYGPLGPGDVLTFANNATVFQDVYGFAPTASFSTGGVADSNGDDNIALRNGSTIYDLFGVPGVDGSGNAHEFEDGRAERKSTVTAPSATWVASEWNVDNDSGGGDGPQDAPNGFDPGQWIGLSIGSDPTLTVGSNVSGLDYFEGSGPSIEDSFSVDGINLTNDITVDAPTNFEISLTSGGTFSSSLVVTQSDGTASSSIYVRLVSGLAPETYTGNATVSSIGADSQIVSLSGTVTAADPQITVTAYLDDFNYIASNGGPSAEDSFSVEGLFLQGDVIITAPENYEVSLTTSTGYANTQNITPDQSGTIASTDVFVRLKAALSTGTYTGNIIVSSTGLTEEPIAVYGNVYGPPTNSLVITGAYDGPLTGGTPKGIELYVLQDIPDLSLYGISSISNGGGTSAGTVEYNFPADAVTEGTYIYLATEATQFNTFFGLNPTYVNGVVGINGDDSIELYENGQIIDTFGDVNMDGSDQTWDYLDGWAYRNSNTGPEGTTFTPTNWTYSGANAFDNQTLNSTASIPFPIGTYSNTTASVNNNQVINFSIFPNPTNTGFVTIKSNQMGAVQAQVFDLLGKEVINTVVNNERLDVGNLNAGVYVVKLTQNKNTTTKKLIIQ
jgi:hypothetical protein